MPSESLPHESPRTTAATRLPNEPSRAEARHPTPYSRPQNPSTSPPHVRRMGLHDLPFVVGLHYENFPSSFFARLGRRFLTRYYRTFLDGPLAVAIISEDIAGPQGFLVGVLDRGLHRQLMLRHHGLALAATGIAALIVRPHLAVTFARTRLARYITGMRRAVARNPASTPMTATDTPDGPEVEGDLAVLSFVAVASRSRCRGHGTALVDEFVRLATEARCADACLVTEESNSVAQIFYERRNWKTTSPAQVRAETRAEGQHRRYRRNLHPARTTSRLDDPAGPLGPSRHATPRREDVEESA